MKVYWGDLHNHCGITYGFGTLENALARAKSQLDFCCITGHAMWPDMYEEGPGTEFVVGFHRAGFQKLKDHWEEVRAKMAEANTEDFVVFQGYEMHSGAFGDHHVLTRNDRMVLQDCETPEELVEVCGPGAVAVPHHIGYTPGYRGIDWGKFNSRISPVVEVYSKHGCAMAEDADYPYYHDMGPRDSRNTVLEGLRQGHHFGFVASTDHHAGFPGSYGDGLAAVLAEEKSREGIWKAILARHTYAVTGDRILCDFRVNGGMMGDEITSPGKRLISGHVETEYGLDKIVIYKNGTPLHVINGEQYAAKGVDSCFKLRLEFGWGSQELYRWNGRIQVEGGDILSAVPYFRGRSVLAPSETEKYDPDTVNDICTDICLENKNSVSFCCDTVGNKSTLHPSTSAVLVKIRGGEETKVKFCMNGKNVEASVGELLAGGYTMHMEQYHSQAFKIHRALPESQFSFGFEYEDQGPEQEWDYYHMEVAQKNRQWAYVSPVFVSRSVF